MFEQAFKNIDDVLRKEAGCTTELDYSEQTSWLLFLKYLDGLEQDKAMEAGLEGRKFAFILDEPIVGKAGPHDPPEPPVSGPEPGPRPRKIKIMLADGKARDPAHDDDELLAPRRRADVGEAIHGIAVRRAARALQGRGRASRPVEHATNAKIEIGTRFNSKQQVFLSFVLSHYVRVGVEELDREKLRRCCC